MSDSGRASYVLGPHVQVARSGANVRAPCAPGAGIPLLLSACVPSGCFVVSFSTSADAWRMSVYRIRIPSRQRTQRQRQSEGRPDFRPRESGRRDADDLQRPVVDRDPRADRRKLAAVFVLPESIAEHHARIRTAARIVLGRKQAPGRGSDVGRRKKSPLTRGTGAVRACSPLPMRSDPYRYPRRRLRRSPPGAAGSVRRSGSSGCRRNGTRRTIAHWRSASSRAGAGRKPAGSADGRHPEVEKSRCSRRFQALR